MDELFDTWIASLSAPGCVWGFAIPWLCVRRRRDRFRLNTGRCRVCQYSLEGLPADALCPECGTPDPELIVIKERGRWDFRFGRVRVMMPLVPIAFGLPLLMLPAWYLAWRWGGWPEHIARRYAFGAPESALVGGGVAWAIAVALIAKFALTLRRSRRRWTYGLVYGTGPVTGLAATWVLWEADGGIYHVSPAPAILAAMVAGVAGVVVWLVSGPRERASAIDVAGH